MFSSDNLFSTKILTNRIEISLKFNTSKFYSNKILKHLSLIECELKLETAKNKPNFLCKDFV